MTAAAPGDPGKVLTSREIAPGWSGGADALAVDGAIIRIRPVTPLDAAGLTDLHERAGDESLYRRFLSIGHHSIAGEVARLIRPPDATFAVLVALERGQMVGVCSYELLPGTSTAEFAVFVDDAAHHRGIGTLLLEHLAVHARRHGIPDLLGEVLPSNREMLRVATGLGQPVRSAFDLGLVEVHLDTSAADNDVLDTRDLAAAGRSLSALFTPTCVAVIGAGRSPGGVGHSVLRAIVDGGFTGTVYAIHPAAGNPATDRIAGAPAYSGFAAAPLAPDLVIIAVPAANVAAVLADASLAGARAAVVLSAGFSEDGPDGATRQQQLVRVARAAGMRLVGPNCFGILNNDPAVRLHGTFATAAPGGLAVASQSGAVGISLLDQATKAGLGVSSFVSLGNKADVSGNDLLSYWFEDSAAKAIALYLESLGNPRRFAHIARAVGRRKPVLAVKSGRSAVGSRAGAAHTAAAPAPDATIDALFAQAGVIRCDGLGDLLDTARMLIDQPLPAGGRVAIVGNAGGINVLCADAADAAGLHVPELPPDVQATIRAGAPDATAVANPVDLGAAASADTLATAIRAIAPHVDAVVVAFGATMAADVRHIVDMIGAAADDTDVPMAVVLLGIAPAPTSLGARRAPVYPLPENAIAALGRAVRYATWRRTPLGNRPDLPGIDTARARDLIAAALAAGGGSATPPASRELLACYGIRVQARSPAPTGVELIAGITHDPLFGSILMCGLGGVHTDLLDDRSLRLLPVTDRDAAQMWRGLRAAPLLTGYRGAAAVDTAAVEDLLLRLGRLAEDFPQIAELDLNPVIVTPTGITIVDVKVRIVDVGPEPDAALRALREPG